MTRLTLAAIRAYLQGRDAAEFRRHDLLEAAVALVLVPHARNGVELLLIKRAAAEGDPWSGQMALPGGRRDRGDVRLLETARRETHEETGIALTPGSLLGRLDDLHPLTATLPPVVVRPFVFGLPNRPEVKPNEEVALHLWTPLSDLKSGTGTEEVLVRGKTRRVPAYLIDGHVVWGMTWRIIKPIIDLV
jgi:8-oxo-dGTP pyrophosphatase MutT (NUDIX family)